MSLMKEADPRFVRLERKVGLFVLVACTAVVVIVVFAAAQQGLLVPKTNLTFTAEGGKDLREGMAVKFSGFRIGKVKKLSLRAWAEVAVTISIDKHYMKWIRSDSKAILVQETILAEPIIEITPGSPMATAIPENGAIPFERRVGLNDMLAELDGIKQLLNDVRRAGIGETLLNARRMSDQMLVSVAQLDVVLDSAQQTLTKMDSVADHAGATIRNTDDAVKELDGLLDSAAVTSSKVDGLIAAVEQDYPSMMTKTHTILDNFEQASGDLKTAAQEAPSMALKGGGLLDETSDILNAVETLWPIRSRIPAREHKMLPVDSYE
jgi:phospholipid/cholesterol/gamma-HCH transport system substrate-binding protein